MRKDGTLYYLHTDHLNSTSLLLDGGEAEVRYYPSVKCGLVRLTVCPQTGSSPASGLRGGLGCTTMGPGGTIHTSGDSSRRNRSSRIPATRRT